MTWALPQAQVIAAPLALGTYMTQVFQQNCGFALKRYPRKRDGESNPRWQRFRESCSFDRRQPPDRAAQRAVAA